MKTSYDSQQRRYDNQLPMGWDDEDDRTNDMEVRLDELDKKADRYEDDCNILLDQQSEVLDRTGKAETDDEREVLRLRLISLGAAIMLLEPLTTDEIAERLEIKEKLNRG